ncbi:MAG: glycosyltransferase [Thermomicrobiaceae bacterium]
MGSSVASSLVTTPGRVLMLGTFGMKPKGTMSARAAGIASTLQSVGWQAKIVTTPWDNPEDAGASIDYQGVPVMNTRVIRPVLWPLPVLEMVAFARRFQPDVVHLFKPKGFGDLAARLLRRMGYPVVVDMDDWEGSGGWNDVLPYSALQRRVFDWQERTWPVQASAMTVASQTLYYRAIELGANANAVMYLPNALPESRIRQLRNPPTRPHGSYLALSDNPATNILLYTRFVEFDPAFAVDVLARTLNRIPDARLVVAGSSADGSSERRLLDHAHKAGVASQIVFLGWIYPEDLGWIARQCSAALVLFDDTIINRAKCSVKLLELIACGIPVVASAVGENRHYLAEAVAGNLARPADPGHHADLLVEAVSSLTGSRRISPSYAYPAHWGESIGGLAELYKSTISRH